MSGKELAKVVERVARAGVKAPCGHDRDECRGCSNEDCPLEQHKQLVRTGMLSLMSNVRRNGRLL
jgi:hypothetical protein